jgi:hypothetical protein
MKKIWRSIVCFYRMVTVIGVAFAAWKLSRLWHAGLAEKTGHALNHKKEKKNA